MVISKEENMLGSEKYAVYLIVYEPKYEEMKEILKIKKFSKLTGYSKEGAKKKVEKVKERLDSDNPILAISKTTFYPANTMEKIILELNNDDLKENPDKYLKPLDIV